MIWISSDENVRNLPDALTDAGFGTATLTDSQEILSNEITIFKDRVRIDVQTSTPGLIFDEAWERREMMKYQGQEFYVVSLNDLISLKRTAGRDVDSEDVRLLELPELSSILAILKRLVQIFLCDFRISLTKSELFFITEG